MDDRDDVDELDYIDDQGYRAYLVQAAKDCSCCSCGCAVQVPCPGVLAGGFCDQAPCLRDVDRFDDEDDFDPWEDDTCIE